MTRGEKALAFEAMAVVAIRVGDGFVRSQQLGPERFAPQRFLAPAIVYAGLGAIAAFGPAAADVAGAIGGLIVLTALITAAPNGKGGTVGTEIAQAFGGKSAASSTGPVGPVGPVGPQG